MGIETSCDETAVCVIDAGGTFGPDFRYKILGNALYSQIAIHAPYGGVFPNLAKREHARNLVPIMTEALSAAALITSRQGRSSVSEAVKGPSLAINLDEQIRTILAREPELYDQLIVFLKSYPIAPSIDAIAVTAGPGLEPALWVGVNFARALSTVWGLPLVAVNHMEGHIVLSAMQADSLASFDFPLLSLLISGGHTELVLSSEFQKYEMVGETRDDAVGEAFDKVARLLGLPYPGGPEVSRLAALERIAHPESRLQFTPPMLYSKDLDFSFSGLKTEVRRYIETLQRGRTSPELIEDDRLMIACAFEDAVAQVLSHKTKKAIEDYNVATLVVGGGVSANTYIRAALLPMCRDQGAKLLVPPPDLATDNAIMIALAGYFNAIKKEYSDPATLIADGNWRLGSELKKK